MCPQAPWGSCSVRDHGRCKRTCGLDAGRERGRRKGGDDSEELKILLVPDTLHQTRARNLGAPPGLVQPEVKELGPATFPLIATSRASMQQHHGAQGSM